MIQKKIVGLLISGFLVTVTTPTYADVYVHGYTKKDGTYVKPHYRSDSDGNFNNNWSTKGNTNPYTGKEGTKTYPNYSVGNEYNQQISAPNFDTKQFEEIQNKATEDFIKKQNEIMKKYKGNEYNQQISALTKQFEKNKKASDDFIKKQNEIMTRYAGNSKKQQEEIDKLLKELDEVGNYTTPIISNVSTDTNEQDTTNNQTNTLDTKNNDSVDSVSKDKTVKQKVSASAKPSFWDKFINFIQGLFN